MFTAGDQMFQSPPRPLPMDSKWKPNIEHAPNCPRCASPNTKFCYYNNYSLSQPRYFCKGCRRYWTKGGSLRNVPVGGGCRKNRRAKSVRLAQNERVSMNYSKYLNTFGAKPNESLENACSSNADNMLQPSGTNGSDIDLAVVFAKFLNQNSSLEPEFVNQELPNEANALIDVSNSLTIDSCQNDTMIECQQPSDPVNEVDLLQELPQLLVGEKQQEEEKIQEFMESDINAFGLQSLLSDEVVQDVLWSDPTTMPNFTWQPMVQLQEFDSFPVDDRLRNSTNFVSDNWSSFDLSGFEVFSRP